MAKNRETEYEKIEDNTKIIKVQVEAELKKSFIAYAMAVNVSRAIPDVRDGLKPVHRRILFAMNELGLSGDKPHKKCARIVGEVLGKYHPHGDSSVYDALVRLAQDFSIRVPLVDGHGNFGSVDGDSPAAMRYTEARLAKISAEMLRDIDKSTVDYYPNFDDTLMQPVVLPARFPNLLVNGADGIAVGMATSIPPHNLGEVIDGTIALIDNPDLTCDDLMQYIPAPDFPTAGLILGRAAIKQAYRTGKGGIVMRARCEIDDFHNGTRQRIVVTELPYQVNKAKLIETIAELVKDKKLEGISDIKEESDRKGMRIVIEVKRDASAQIVLNMLYKHTNLQVKTGITFLALKDGVPKIMNLKEMLEAYIAHQIDIILRRTKYDLEKAEERDHLLRGLVTALANIDEVIAIIRGSKETNEAQTKLIEIFELSEKQSKAILEMRLSRLTSLEVEKLNDELNTIKQAIEEYHKILQSQDKVREIIKSELTDIKVKYGEPRISELTYDYGEIDIADLIEKEDIVISMTHSGYIKRIPVGEYKSQRRGGMGVTAHKTKEEDFVENMFTCNTHDTILFFSNLGRVYSLMGYDLPEGERVAKGRAIVNLLQLDDGEKVTALMPFVGDNNAHLMLATRRGLIKKTNLTEFASIRKGGKIAISLLESDELIAAQLTSGNDELILASSSGKCIRFSEVDVRAVGRTSQGVRSMKLEDDDYIVDMTLIKPNCEVLTISQKGFGKRTDIDEYRLQSRAGKGTKAGIFNDETGRLVGLKLMNKGDDIMIITDNGIIIRVSSEEIRMIGRATKGVRIMRTKNEGNVVCVSIIGKEDEVIESGEIKEDDNTQSII